MATRKVRDERAPARPAQSELDPQHAMDDALSVLVPVARAPLVIGRRGFTELLSDLAVATDDLSS